MDFLTAVHDVISAADGWLWGIPLIVILVGTHVFMTIRTRGIQRKIGTGLKLSVTKDPEAEGNVSQFGALTTALSATIGTGNIVGVATAVVSGGVGAVFWMWIIGVFGIATKYAETFISVKYRVKDHKGDMLGGAMYALERGFKGKKWAKVVAVLFATFATLASFGIGAATQSNSTVGIVQNYLPDANGVALSAILGIVLVVLVAAVIIGGIQSISKVCEKVIPFMAVFYVLGCIIIICINGAYFTDAVKWILTCAFSPRAMIGGGVGFAVMSALRFGAARGLFSNESGMGSAPLAAANATTRNPARQSLVSMTGTFWDTVIICAVTGLMLTTSILASPELSQKYQATNALATSDVSTIEQMAKDNGMDSAYAEQFAQAMVDGDTATVLQIGLDNFSVAAEDAATIEAAIASGDSDEMAQAVELLPGEYSEGFSLLQGFQKGLQLTTSAFGEIPVIGPIVLIVGIVLFSFTTMIGWSWYGNRTVAYLFGKKGIRVYQIVFLVFIFIGALGGSVAGLGYELTSLVWDFSDLMNGLMVIPNVIAVLALSGLIARETKHYVYDKNLDEKDESEIPVYETK